MAGNQAHGGHPPLQDRSLRTRATLSLAGVLLAAAAVARPPEVEAIWPRPASPGEVVRLSGSGFASEPAGNRVWFGDHPALVLASGPAELLVEVPAAADEVAVRVETAGGASRPLPFRLLPVARWDPPGKLARGQSATLELRVIGTREPVAVEVVSLAPAAVSVAGAPRRELLTTGGERNVERVELHADAGGTPAIFARPLPFRALAPCPPPVAPPGVPEIWEVVPGDPSAGEPIRILGRGLGEAPEGTAVTLEDQSLQVLSASSTELLVRLPDDPRGSRLQVRVATGDDATAPSASWTLRVRPSLRLAADRLDLRRGERATITATLAGTAEPLPLTVVLTTPDVAALAGGVTRQEVVTSGGTPNQASFAVVGRRRGSFHLVATLARSPGEPARLEGPAGGLTARPAEPSPVPLDVRDLAGRPLALDRSLLTWEVIPAGLGEVDSQGVFTAAAPGCGSILATHPILGTIAVPVGVPETVYDALDDGCDWRRICVDVVIVARRRADGAYDLGPAFQEAPELISGQKPVEVVVPAAAFTAAGGALADLAGLEAAATLRANLGEMLRTVNSIYEPCCVWFSLGRIWAVDPEKARISRDGTTLAAFVTRDPDGHPGLSSTREVRIAEGKVTLLDGLQRFLADHAGVPRRQCLKLLLARGFQGIPGEQGRAQQGGDHCGCGLQQLSLSSTGITVAHELGHNLGLEHWKPGEADPRRINVMAEVSGVSHRPRPYFDPSQCDLLRQRAESLGTQEAPPAPPPERPRGEPPGPAPEPGPRPPEGEPERPRPPPDPEPEDEERPCRCPDPEAKVLGLEELRNLRARRTAEGRAVYETCCARVRLVAKLERATSGRYHLEWSLELEVLDRACFVGFELDRYFNSKAFGFFRPGHGDPIPRTVPIKSARLLPAGADVWRLDGEGGFERDYAGVPGDLSDARLYPGADASLTRDRNRKEWRVLLGGVIRCKDGDEVREFPFHLEFAKRADGEVELRAASGREPADPPQGLVRGPLARVP